MSKIEKAARQLYNELSDMDYHDYDETQDNDIDYIAGIIARYGYNKALSILSE